MVVSGDTGQGFLDELSTLGENTIAEFYHDHGFSTVSSHPADFPLQPATLADLCGGNADESAVMIRDILSGKDHGPRRDAVLLNAGAALVVADRAKSIADGWHDVAEILDSGKATAKLEELAG
jgi:anthranilate phosphoribosyltransferase